MHHSFTFPSELLDDLAEWNDIEVLSGLHKSFNPPSVSRGNKIPTASSERAANNRDNLDLGNSYIASQLPNGFPECNYIEILGAIPERHDPLSVSRCNRIPITSSDRVATQDNIDFGNCSIRALEAELKSIQIAEAKIQERLSNIRQYVAVQSSLLSPIRRLPEETLAKIFDMVQEGKVVVSDLNTPKIWELQHVCAHWRTIVQNTPLIWSTFEVTNFEDRDRVHESRRTIEERVQACLEYSAMTPLTITISLTTCYNVFQTIFELIAQHANRWKSLEVDLGYVDHALSFTDAKFYIEARGLPKLNALRLSVVRMRRIETEDIWQIFTPAKALEEFKLQRVMPPNPSTFPYNNMKRFSVELETYRGSEDEIDIGSLLSAMPSLEELTWETSSRDLKAIASEIPLPLLNTLSITDSEKLYPILQHLRVPSLSTLTIKSSRRRLDDALSQLLQFLSSCTITKLQLDLDSLQDVWEIVKKLPAVRELILSDRGFSSSFFRRLVWSLRHDQRQPTVLPSLQTLELTVTTYQTAIYPSLYVTDYDYLPQLAQSRSPSTIGEKFSPPVPLRSICLSFSRYISQENEWERWKKLCEDIRKVGVEAVIR